MKTVPTAAISSRKPRILVADNSAVAREGIAAIIWRNSRYTLCGSAVDRRTTIQLLEQHKPDVLLLELFLGSCDGLFLVKEIAAQFPKTRILVISKQPENVYAERVLRAGASGYWLKTGTCEELIHAIETIIAGELYVSPRIACVAVQKLIENPAAYRHASNLTDRELHVFGLIGAGFGTSRIAKELGISPRTVETYDEHIKIKLKTGTCEELIHAIETIIAGELYVSPRIACVAVQKLIENPAAYRHASNLTDRELHVFGLIGAGFGTSRIAKELGISPRTVETYDEHIKIKLGYPDAHALHQGAREWFELSHDK